MTRSGLVFALALTGCVADDAGVDETSMTGGSSTSSTSEASASTGAPAQGEETLVRADAWTPMPSDESDPFGSPPADRSCESGWGLESGLFEIDSGVCSWGTFEQPSLAPIAAGDSLEFVLVHDALYAPEEGTSAHLGVAVGSDIVWEHSIPIPSEAGFLRPVFEAPADAPVDTPLRFHVHNHGVNNYRLVDLTVTHR